MIEKLKSLVNRNPLLFYTGLRRKLVVTEKMLWLYRWRQPIKPYAFIRVNNEIKTIDACLKSILPLVKGGVIGFYDNDQDDGTREYVLAFCRKHPQFRPLHYPHQVVSVGSPEYRDDQLDPRRRFDQFSNAVWSQLPKNEWIIKVDGDHVYHEGHVTDLCRLPVRQTDCVFLSRFNLHYFEGRFYVRQDAVVEPGDHWLIFNGELIPDNPFVFEFVDDGEIYIAREAFSADFRRFKIIYSILSNWHFPRLKEQRQKYKLSRFVPFEEGDVYQGGRFKGRIPADMIDLEQIKAVYQRFNNDGKKILPD